MGRGWEGGRITVTSPFFLNDMRANLLGKRTDLVGTRTELIGMGADLVGTHVELVVMRTE